MVECANESMKGSFSMNACVHSMCWVSDWKQGLQFESDSRYEIVIHSVCLINMPVLFMERFRIQKSRSNQSLIRQELLERC